MRKASGEKDGTSHFEIGDAEGGAPTGRDAGGDGTFRAVHRRRAPTYIGMPFAFIRRIIFATGPQKMNQILVPEALKPQMEDLPR